MNRRAAAVAAAALAALPLFGCGKSEDAPVSGEERSYCAVAKDLSSLYRTAVGVDADSSMTSQDVAANVRRFEEQIEVTVARGKALFIELKRAAPEAQRADVALVGDDATAQAERLRSLASDPLGAMSELAPASQDAEVVEAKSRVDAYTNATCGFVFGPPAAPDPAISRPPERPEPPEPPEPSPP